MPQYDVLAMSQIADHAGYRNADTMRDERKRRFGLTPRRIREQR